MSVLIPLVPVLWCDIVLSSFRAIFSFRLQDFPWSQSNTHAHDCILGWPCWGWIWMQNQPAFFFFNCFIYLFIFGCAGSSLLLGIFSTCDKRELLFSCSVCASHCGSFSCCRVWALGHTGFSRLQFLASRAQAQWSWYTGFVALQHVESSLTRDWTLVSCFDRQILNHWATRSAPRSASFYALSWDVHPWRGHMIYSNKSILRKADFII